MLTRRAATPRVEGTLAPDPNDPPTRVTAIANLCKVYLATVKDVYIEDLTGGTFQTGILHANPDVTGLETVRAPGAFRSAQGH